MNNGYAQRVLGSNMTWNILRVPRRSGKTNLIIEWVLEAAKQNIAYMSPNRDGLLNIALRIRDQFPGLVQMHSRDIIRLANGTTIFRMPEGDNVQGRRVDRIAVEDAGELSNMMVPVVRRVVSDGDVKVLILASEVRNDSFFYYFENTVLPLTDAYYEEYDWMDAVTDGVFSREDISQLSAEIGQKKFEEQFGPWNTIKKFEIEKKNKNFKHLLKK
jgi:hypothetical protein